MQDFFFGEIYKLRKTKESYIELSNACELAGKVDAAFFTAQLNRLLMSTGGHFVLLDGTSYPCFQALLEGLQVSEIGFIEIQARTDINDSVKATLECSIWLAQGVIHIRTHWCAYKPIRADEIVSTLLAPLHRKGLVGKTYIRWSSNDAEVFPSELREQVESVFRLSKYPYSSCLDSDRDRMAEYVQELSSAGVSALQE